MKALFGLAAVVAATSCDFRSGAICDQGMVYCVEFSPTARVLAVGGRRGRTSDGLIRLYDLDGGDLKASRLHRKNDYGSLLSLTFSADGSLLATVDKQGDVALWHLKAGEKRGLDLTAEEHRPLAIPAKSKNAPGVPMLKRCLCFSRDARRLFVGGADGVVRIFKLEDGALVAELAGHTGTVTGVVSSPSGRFIATAGGQDGIVILWDAKTLSLIRQLCRGTAVVTDLTFQADGVLVAAYAPGGIASSGPVRMEYPEEQLRTWNTLTGEMVDTSYVGGDGVLSVDFSPDGRVAAVGYSHEQPSEDNAVALIDWRSRTRLATIRGRWARCRARWNRSGRLLAVIAGRFVELWDAGDARNPRRVWHEEWRWSDSAETP